MSEVLYSFMETHEEEDSGIVEPITDHEIAGVMDFEDFKEYFISEEYVKYLKSKRDDIIQRVMAETTAITNTSWLSVDEIKKLDYYRKQLDSITRIIEAQQR